MAQYVAVEEQERRAWAIAASLATFTAYQLAAQSHVRLEIVRPLIRAWKREGIVSLQAVGRRRRHVYAFVAAPRAIARPAGSAAENMWRTVRKLQRFTPADVQMHSSTGAAPVSEEDARRFCALLLRAGYVRVLRKAALGRHPAMYLLVRDTGPKPPEERRVRAVWDPNERAWTHVPEPAA